MSISSDFPKKAVLKLIKTRLIFSNVNNYWIIFSWVIFDGLRY